MLNSISYIYDKIDYRNFENFLRNDLFKKDTIKSISELAIGITILWKGSQAVLATSCFTIAQTGRLLGMSKQNENFFWGQGHKFAKNFKHHLGRTTLLLGMALMIPKMLEQNKETSNYFDTNTFNRVMEKNKIIEDLVQEKAVLTDRVNRIIEDLAQEKVVLTDKVIELGNKLFHEEKERNYFKKTVSKLERTIDHLNDNANKNSKIIEDLKKPQNSLWTPFLMAASSVITLATTLLIQGIRSGLKPNYIGPNSPVQCIQGEWQ